MVRAALVVAAVSCVACRQTEIATPVATVSVTLNRAVAKLGGPVNATFTFTVADRARFDKNYWVMLHFVDADNRLMWIDDHRPPTPTSQWQPGRPIEYTRTIFVPRSLQVDAVSLQVGLYLPDTQERLPLAGEEIGDRAYHAASIRLEPAHALEFKDGWHDPEGPVGDAVTRWRWTKRQATLAFGNPKKDAILYLDVGSAEQFPRAPRVSVSLGGAVVDEFDVAPRSRVLRSVRLDAARLGASEMAEATIAVDQTFVPAAITAGASSDVRELGIRVFNAAIEPVP